MSYGNEVITFKDFNNTQNENQLGMKVLNLLLYTGMESIIGQMRWSTFEERENYVDVLEELTGIYQLLDEVLRPIFVYKSIPNT